MAAFLAAFLAGLVSGCSGVAVAVLFLRVECRRRQCGSLCWVGIMQRLAVNARRASLRACDADGHACIVAQVQGKESAGDQAVQLQRTIGILYDSFPRHVVQAVRDGVELVPERREMATVLFLDIAGFAEICSLVTADKVLDMLHRLFCQLDRLSAECGVFKVGTHGDTYMGAANLVSDQSADHAKRVAQFAGRAMWAANETLVDADDATMGYVSIRIGFDCGPIVAGVVGMSNRGYRLFGDTVNTALQMQSASFANHVLCSARAAQVLREQAPMLPVCLRGTIPVKGKGEMATYLVKCGDLADVY